MERFWEHSWKRGDPERVAEYVQSIDMAPDALISALHRHGVKTVCDAGCGCGAYAMKLAANGFSVCGFDVSSHAVEIAQTLLEKAALAAELKTAGILSTGYADGTFDGVVCRDVLDHLPRAEAAAAVKELCRITKPGGITMFEAIHSQTPLYVNKPFLIQEAGNAAWIEAMHIGVVHWDDGRDPAQDILDLLENDVQLAEMKYNMQAMSEQLRRVPSLISYAVEKPEETLSMEQ